MFVDATGDGDLMARAGLPTAVRGNFHTYMGLRITLESCALAARTGNIGAATGYFAGGDATLYGEKHPEGLPLYDGTDSDEVNRYLLQNQLEMLKKLQGQDRLSRDMVTLPGMCQFRTTRRIEGDYVLQESDAYRHFDDSIAAICDFNRRDYLFEVPRRALVRSGWDQPRHRGPQRRGRGLRLGRAARHPAGDRHGPGRGPALLPGAGRVPRPSTLPTSAPCRPSSRARICCCTSTTRTCPRRAPRRTNTTTDTREDER